MLQCDRRQWINAHEEEEGGFSILITRSTSSSSFPTPQTLFFQFVYVYSIAPFKSTESNDRPIEGGKSLFLEPIHRLRYITGGGLLFSFFSARQRCNFTNCILQQKKKAAELSLSATRGKFGAARRHSSGPRTSSRHQVYHFSPFLHPPFVHLPKEKTDIE